MVLWVLRGLFVLLMAAVSLLAITQNPGTPSQHSLMLLLHDPLDFLFDQYRNPYGSVGPKD